MEERLVHVPNISCGHCVRTIEREVGELPGVIRVEASAETKNVRVQWASPASWPKIQALLAELDYPAVES